ncbi:hypothetical protein AgCh_024065 [Apium graveolens]
MAETINTISSLVESSASGKDNEEECTSSRAKKARMGQGKVGYLFPTTPKPFMTRLLFGDDLWKLGKTKLGKKVKRIEKHTARDRKRRKRAERELKQVKQERHGLVADLDLITKDVGGGFAAI